MHRVLYLIVEAESKEDAVDTATARFGEDFVDNSRYTFDYCKAMHPGSSVSGAGRWTQFADEPNAAPLDSEQGREWIEQAMEHTERHYAENLFGLFSEMVACLEGSVETAPEAVDEILELVKENREMHSGDGGELLKEEYPNTIEALFREEGGGTHRYYAGEMREDNPMQGHVIDYRTYGHMTVADGGYSLENVEEMLEDTPENAWVVPLDTHF